MLASYSNLGFAQLLLMVALLAVVIRAVQVWRSLRPDANRARLHPARILPATNRGAPSAKVRS